MGIATPPQLTEAFATSGTANTIPVPSQISITPGAASFTDGFPPLTATPIGSGGIPPSVGDMNGILKMISAHVAYLQSGAGYQYNSTISTAISGYNIGAVLLAADNSGYWMSTTNNNVTDPDTGGAGWVPISQYGVATISGLAGANVTLTAPQYGKSILVLQGALTANISLTFPSIVGNWLIVNETTGAYTITCKNSAGSTTTVPQGGWSTAAVVYDDGTNIYSQTGSFVTSSQLTATLASYVTSAQLSTTLSGYVTASALASDLASYVTTGALTSALASYLTTSAAASTYVSNASLTSTLNSYLTKATAASTYVTNSLLSTALSAYVTAASLSSTLSAYATNAALSAALTPYLTNAIAAATYAGKTSPTFAGTPTAPTAAAGTRSTQIATTAFVTPGSSYSTNSYRKNADGSITQFGLDAAVAGAPGTYIAFPTPFPTACRAVNVTAYGGNATVSVLSWTNNGFYMINGTNSYNSWTAEGN